MKKKTLNVKPKQLSVSSHKRNEAKYDKDFFEWTQNQANFLKKEEFLNLDIKNLIEEIESLGRSEKRTPAKLLRNPLDAHVESEVST